MNEPDDNIPTGGWQTTPGGPVTLPFVERQREMLLRVREILARQVERDKESLTALNEKLSRLRHGGGS